MNESMGTAIERSVTRKARRVRSIATAFSPVVAATAGRKSGPIAGRPTASAAMKRRAEAEMWVPPATRSWPWDAISRFSPKK